MKQEIFCLIQLELKNKLRKNEPKKKRKWIEDGRGCDIVP